jgi:hypothetical protein
MKRRLIWLVVLIVFNGGLANAQGGAAQEFCFEMRIGKGVKRVLFSFEDEDWKRGTVQYAGQQHAVKIRQKADKLLRSNPGRPDYRRYDFEEIGTGKVTGLYSFSLQGVNFDNVYYLRYKDRKKFKMKRPESADEDCFVKP